MEFTGSRVVERLYVPVPTGNHSTVRVCVSWGTNDALSSFAVLRGAEFDVVAETPQQEVQVDAGAET